MKLSALLVLMLATAGASAAPAPALPAAVSARQPVLDAYKSGKVRLKIVVDKSAPDGGKVQVSVEGTGEESLKLVVPKGRTIFPGQMPLETFTVELAAEKPLDVAKDAPATFDALQKGEYRALSGSFSLEFDEGTAYFTGSVEAGPVEER